MYISGVWWLLVGPHQTNQHMVGDNGRLMVHVVLFSPVSSHEERDCSDILVSVVLHQRGIENVLELSKSWD